MKTILNIILIVILLIIFLYNFKNIREGLEIITAKSQPPVDSALYDFNLRQAKTIWNKIGCTDGSYKPTTNNKNYWAKEDYEEELKAYKLEADKLHKEHNYYIYIGKNSDGSNKKINRRDAVGISTAWKRCYDTNSNLGNYIYPKLGDRVKIKKDENSDISKYYTGIVINDYNKAEDKVEVLWDSQGNEGTTQKDRKRTETKNLGVQVNRNKNIKNDIAEFGWPYHEWNRHPDSNKKKDKFVAENGKGWANWTGIFMDDGKVDPKQIYKMTECKKDTECDNLHCGKRRTEILNRYPITYYCESDSRNDKPLGKGFYCKGGNADGAITQYFHEKTMCFKQEKGAKYGRKFCKDMCGGEGENCQIYDDEHDIHKKFYNKEDCYALAYDKDGYRGNRAYIKHDKQYSKGDLEKMGLNNGTIRSISLHGQYCEAITDGDKIFNKYPTDSIKLKKVLPGCKLTFNNNETYYFEKKKEAGVKNGKEYSIDDDKISSFSLEGVGGLATNNCSVEFNIKGPIVENVPITRCGGDEICNDASINGNLSSITLFEYTPPFHVLKAGIYKIKSKRNGSYCRYNDPGAAAHQKKRMHCGPGKGSNKWWITPIDKTGNDSYSYRIESYPGGQDCYFEKKGVDWYIKCTWGNKGREKKDSKFIFEIKPLKNDWKEKNMEALSKDPNFNGFIDPGWCTLKNKYTGKYCSNAKDIFAPGGATMICDRNNADTWEQYEFEFIK